MTGRRIFKLAAAITLGIIIVALALVVVAIIAIVTLANRIGL